MEATKEEPSAMALKALATALVAPDACTPPMLTIADGEPKAPLIPISI
jgi:hypothetical protein